MSIEENKAIVRRYFEEGLNRQKLAIVYELLGPDFINHSPRLDTVGREETALDLERIFTAFPDWHTVIEDIVAEGDKVVVRRSISGTHSGDVPGIPMPPTGKRVTFAAWDMYRVAGGMMLERWGIHNLREQLGAVDISG